MKKNKNTPSWEKSYIDSPAVSSTDATGMIAAQPKGGDAELESYKEVFSEQAQNVKES